LFALRCTIAVAGLLALRLLNVVVAGLLTLGWTLTWGRGLFAGLLVLGLVIGFNVDTVLDRIVKTSQVELARDGLDRSGARR